MNLSHSWFILTRSDSSVASDYEAQQNEAHFYVSTTGEVPTSICYACLKHCKGHCNVTYPGK